MFSTSLPKIYSLSNMNKEVNDALEIAHIGVGNFHRSHQQSYLNELMNIQEYNKCKWKYTGIGMLPHDKEIQIQLKKNNYKYHIVSIDNDGKKEIEAINTLSDYIIAYEDVYSCVLKLADPNIKIVSLTITEHGYGVPLTETDRIAINSCMNHNPEALNLLSDISTFGLILCALAVRFLSGNRPFTIMSCDNICENGKLCKEKCITEFTELQEWIDRECKFPNTMVDRITPGISKEEIIELEKECMLIDTKPVTCEPYKSWIIEDNFVDDIRPKWENVGVIMTDDVKSYELIKLSILNVTHSYIGHIGEKFTYVHEVMDDFNLFYDIHSILHEEIIPVLEKIIYIEFDLCDYANKVLHRFKNKYIKDRIERINTDKHEKMRKQAIPIYNTGVSLNITMNRFKLWLQESEML